VALTSEIAFQTRYTYDDAIRDIQASEVELDKGLKDRRILVINSQSYLSTSTMLSFTDKTRHYADELRHIAPAFLNHFLELILNLLVSLSMKHTSAPVEGLLSTLADDHEVSRAVSEQVMKWFGEIKDGKWTMDVPSIVKEVGLGILRNHRVRHFSTWLILFLKRLMTFSQHEAIEKDILLTKWKSQVGDTFETSVSLDLLAVRSLPCPNLSPRTNHSIITNREITSSQKHLEVIQFP